MRGTLLRIAAAALSAAALFAGGHVCAHFVQLSGDPPTLRVTLTLYDQDGRPLCQSSAASAASRKKTAGRALSRSRTAGKARIRLLSSRKNDMKKASAV